MNSSQKVEHMVVYLYVNYFSNYIVQFLYNAAELKLVNCYSSKNLEFQWRIHGGGARTRSPSIQILSFSCQIDLMFGAHLSGVGAPFRLGNPGSATDCTFILMMRNFISFFSHDAALAGSPGASLPG